MVYQVYVCLLNCVRGENTTHTCTNGLSIAGLGRKEFNDNSIICFTYTNHYFVQRKEKNSTGVIELRIKHFKLMLWKKDDAVVYKNRKCKNNRNTMWKYVLCSIVGGGNRLLAEEHHLKTNMKKCIKCAGQEDVTYRIHVLCIK